MLSTGVQSYDSDVYIPQFQPKLTDDANFCQTAETYLYTWYKFWESLKTSFHYISLSRISYTDFKFSNSCYKWADHD